MSIIKYICDSLFTISFMTYIRILCLFSTFFLSGPTIFYLFYQFILFCFYAGDTVNPPFDCALM